MMLRSLVDEVVRRRLLPVVLVALLVIIVAPLLFMKSAPDDAPAAGAVPAAATPGKLPVRAEKLLVTTDKAVTPRHRSKGSGQDPFTPPASATPADPAAAGQTASESSSPSGSAPLVGDARNVTTANSDGSTTTASSNKKTRKKTAAAKKPAPKKKSTPPAQSSPVKNVALVNVRFARTMPSKARRVPRLQTFEAGGSVVAMFVKYSPARNKAVFAIAPSTKVSGDVECRRKEGVCRYVDIPAGKHVRLTTRTATGSLVSRRLEVASIKRVTETVAATTTTPALAPRATPLTQATCLLKNLLALPSVIVPSISVDACD